MLDSFGETDYRESRIGLGAAIKKDKVSMGLKFSYLNRRVSDLSSSGGIQGDFGIFVEANKFMSLALVLNNFTRTRLFSLTPLPTFLNVGSNIKVSETINLLTEVDWLIGGVYLPKIGLVAKIKPALHFHTGMQFINSNINLGLSYNYKELTLLVGSQAAKANALSHQVSIFKTFGTHEK